jgi:hypothetical protein
MYTMTHRHTVIKYIMREKGRMYGIQDYVITFVDGLCDKVCHCLETGRQCLETGRWLSPFTPPIKLIATI